MKTSHSKMGKFKVKYRWLLPILFAASTSAMAGTWREATTPHFQIYSDGSEKTLTKFATRLERLDLVLRIMTKTNRESSPVKIKVLLVEDRDAVQRLIGRPNSDIAGFYTAALQGPFMLVDSSTGSGEWAVRAEEILYHEYAHHFTFQFATIAYPRWYSEGFADYIAGTVFKESGNIELGKVLKTRVPTLAFGKWLPLEKLMAGDVRRLDRNEEGMLYAQSWLLVHYMFADVNRIQMLGDYLTRLNQGEKPETAVVAAFGTDFEGLFSQLRVYYRSKLYARRLSGVDFPETDVTIRELPQAEGDMVYYDIWSKLREPGQPLPDGMIEGIRNKTADMTTPEALIVRARAELLDGHAVEAEKLLAPVLKAQPENRDAQILQGSIAIKRAEAETDPKIKEAIVAAARPLIIRANRSNPDDPAPLYLYYQSFLALDAEPSAAAKNGLLRANELLPQDTGMAFNAVEILMNEGAYGSVRQILSPIANSPHGGSVADYAAKIIEKARKLSAEAERKAKGTDGKPTH